MVVVMKYDTHSKKFLFLFFDFFFFNQIENSNFPRFLQIWLPVFFWIDDFVALLLF